MVNLSLVSQNEALITAHGVLLLSNTPKVIFSLKELKSVKKKFLNKLKLFLVTVTISN